MKPEKFIKIGQNFARRLTTDIAKQCENKEETMSLILYTCATCIDNIAYADMKDELLPTQIAFTENLVEKLKEAINLAREVRIGITEANKTKIVTKGV